MVNSVDVAKWFIVNNETFSKNSTDLDTHMKLQKLLYYSQAMNLVVSEENPLFRDNVEAWIYGPVVRDVYREFEYNNLVSKTVSSEDPFMFIEWDEKQLAVLKVINYIYGHKTGRELKDITHSEDPWKNLEHQANNRENPVISKSVIYDFYKDSFQDIFDAYKDYDFDNYKSDRINGNYFKYTKDLEMTEEIKGKLWNIGIEISDTSYFVYLDDDNELVVY